MTPEPPAFPPLPDATVYDGIDAFGIQPDFQSWESAHKPIFKTLVKKHEPKTIIEIGTHKGVSAVIGWNYVVPDCKNFTAWTHGYGRRMTRSTPKATGRKCIRTGIL